MGVSKTRGTPKWMVYNGNPIKMDDLGVPLFLETPMYKLLVRTHITKQLQNAWPPRWAHLGIWNTSSYWVWAYPPWSWHSPWKWMLGRLFSFSEGLFSWAMLLLGKVSINKYSCRTHLGRCPFPFPLFLVGGHDQEEAWSHLPSGEATWPHVVRFQPGEENPYGFHWISMDFFKRINFLFDQEATNLRDFHNCQMSSNCVLQMIIICIMWYRICNII